MTKKTLSDAQRRSDEKRQGFDKDQPSENAGSPLHQGTTANDKGHGGAIPPLDEPDVEGVGNEGGDGD
jgi:hypothetical protein